MAQTDTTAAQNTRAIAAGLLTWLIPGAGHFVLGYRALAVVFFVAITLPYATGLALGGVRSFVNPATNYWLFLAELPIGGYTIPAYFAGRAVERSLAERERRGEPVDLTDYVAYYPASDVAQIYLATAGLLNILAILDAIVRAQTGGLPTFHRELRPAPHTPEGGA